SNREKWYWPPRPAKKSGCLQPLASLDGYTLGRCPLGHLGRRFDRHIEGVFFHVAYFAAGEPHLVFAVFNAAEDDDAVTGLRLTERLPLGIGHGSCLCHDGGRVGLALLVVDQRSVDVTFFSLVAHPVPAVLLAQDFYGGSLLDFAD